MPKVSEQHREQRRAQILDAAMRCFRERGFVATSMADVIAAADLSAGAIYSYFAGKDELAVAAARRILDRRVGAVGAAASDGGGSPAELLRRFLDELVADEVPTELIVQLWGEAAVSPAFAEVASDGVGRLHEALVPALAAWASRTRGIDDREARAWAGTTAPALIGLAQGYLILSAIRPDFDGEAYLAGADALLEGPPRSSADDERPGRSS